MKKNLFWLMFCSFFGFLYSCASVGGIGDQVILDQKLVVDVVNDVSKVGVIIDCRDVMVGRYIANGASISSNNMLSTIKVFIDDKYMGEIDGMEIKGCEIPNGNHTIYFTRTTIDNETGKRNQDESRTETYQFILSDSREIFYLTDDRPRWVRGLPISVSSRVSQKIVMTEKTMDENAIIQSFNTLNPLIPNGAKVAIISISPNNNDGIYVREELTVLFVNARKYIVVDRQTLEIIRQEQNFQMSGEVSDASAVSIGHFLGADVVITGNITASGNQRRLRLKALDVKTAQVLAMSSESI